ncbi:MAG: hypothetical protein KGY70_13830 [Bacteroidales bacterium]|nr:hypothetical protein [Bacteroidales bacterium]MBS3776269.1 hypothetical protein [Bacteroidales bacterium]
MGNLSLNNTTLEKYFGILKNLDDTSKKNLIKKLTKSLKTTKNDLTGLDEIYGAWKDSREADEIIADIKSSRVNKEEKESF